MAMAKQEQFSPVMELKYNKVYSPYQILAGLSTCYIDAAEGSTIPSCRSIPSILKKIYNFDPMEQKLFAVAALALLNQPVPVKFSNVLAALHSVGAPTVDNFGGAVFYNFKKEEVDSIVYFVNPKTGARDMDAVYMKAPHELAHFVMARVVNPMSKGTDAFLPYHNAETESAFKGAVIESIQMALKTVGVTLAAHVSTNEAQKLYCTNAAKIEAQEKELASKAYNSGNQKLFLSALTYAQELQTITFPACKELTRNFLQEMGVRVFEQVANGLASDIGAHPDELHYLQPLVNYTMAHLYPIFDQYIATNCATSTQYTCQMRDGELYSIKLLEVVKVHEDL